MSDAKGKARAAGRQAESTGREVQQSDWLDHAVRVGLIAYGVVHLLVGWLAINLAFGDRSEEASNDGALHALAKQPLGGVLLWVIAVGMLLLVVWRVLEAALGHNEEEDEKKRWFKRATSLGKAIVYGALGWSAVQIAVGKGSSDGTDSATAKLMNVPGGQVLVALVGLSIIGVGGALVMQGLTDQFLKNLDSEGHTGKEGSAYRWIGKVGYIAKGISIGLVGVLFVYAAITHEAKKSGGLDQALQKVLEAPFGPYLLAAIGLGIACYGLFCFAQARRLSR